VDFLKKLRDFTKLNKQHLIISIGGWGKSAGFAPIATKEDTRHKFITHIVEFCEVYGLDGVDYDWEFPSNPQQKKAYANLIVETKNVFKKTGMIVTVAVGSHSQLAPDAYKAVDYVHLMSYDHDGKHSTFKASEADVERHLAFGVPKEKLLLGVPFYGRNLNNRNNARKYSDIVRTYHPAAEADEAGGIYFNGINTIQKKTRYAMENRLAGIMIWEIGQDSMDETSLLGAVKRTVPDADLQQR